MNDDEDKMPESFEKLEALLKERALAHEKRRKFEDEMEELMNVRSDKIERELLMGMWSKLGDSHHNYYTAMRAVAVFVKALDSLRKVTKKLPEELAVIVMEALGECAKTDMEMLQALIETKAKHDL